MVRVVSARTLLRSSFLKTLIVCWTFFAVGGSIAGGTWLLGRDCVLSGLVVGRRRYQPRFPPLLDDRLQRRESLLERIDVALGRAALLHGAIEGAWYFEKLAIFADARSCAQQAFGLGPGACQESEFGIPITEEQCDRDQTQVSPRQSIG